MIRPSYPKVLVLYFGQAGNSVPDMVILHGLFCSGKIGAVLHGCLKKLSGLYVGRTGSWWSPLAASMCYQEMAEDVVSFLDDNGLQRIIFIGHSLVGKTAMKFTVQFPERILSLIMVDIETVQYKHLQKILELIEAM